MSSSSTTREEPSSEDFCEVVDEFGCKAFEMHQVLSDDKEKWVRLQAKPDVEEAMTREEILEKIQQVLQKQAEYGIADSYEREWKPKGVNGEISSGKVNGDSTFSVLQFNMLAQGLSFGPNTQSPFEPTQKLQEYKAKNSYGGFSAVTHPEICLDFELRQWRLLQAILDADCDIIALEELDQYHGFFLPMLQQFGYEGAFLPKAHSPGVKLGWYSDGCAVLYRKSVFDLEGIKCQPYNVGNQVCLVARLRHEASQKVIQVAATHLKAKHDEECEGMRKQQVDQLLQEILNGDEPTIVAGDFNTEPSSESVKQMQKSHTSAYDLDDPDLVTTCKTRGSHTVRRVIDYIFYSKGLSCTATYSVPHKEIEEDKLPSLRYPSDHVLIAAKFSAD